MSQERTHGGGKQGRVSVTGSPDSGGIHSLIGAIDTALLLCHFSGCPKMAFISSIPPIPDEVRFIVASCWRSARTSNWSATRLRRVLRRVARRRKAIVRMPEKVSGVQRKDQGFCAVRGFQEGQAMNSYFPVVHENHYFGS